MSSAFFPFTVFAFGHPERVRRHRFARYTRPAHSCLNEQVQMMKSAEHGVLKGWSRFAAQQSLGPNPLVSLVSKLTRGRSILQQTGTKTIRIIKQLPRVLPRNSIHPSCLRSNHKRLKRTPKTNPHPVSHRPFHFSDPAGSSARSRIEDYADVHRDHHPKE